MADPLDRFVFEMSQSSRDIDWLVAECLDLFDDKPRLQRGIHMLEEWKKIDLSIGTSSPINTPFRFMYDELGDFWVVMFFDQKALPIIRDEIARVSKEPGTGTTLHTRLLLNLLVYPEEGLDHAELFFAACDALKINLEILTPHVRSIAKFSPAGAKVVAMLEARILSQEPVQSRPSSPPAAI